jgi:hypothetical protein
LQGRSGVISENLVEFTDRNLDICIGHIFSPYLD